MAQKRLNDNEIVEKKSIGAIYYYYNLRFVYSFGKCFVKR